MLESRDREKTLEKRLFNTVKKLKGWAIKLLPFELRGLPDRMILIPKGRIFFVEIKTKGKKPSPIQRVVHKKFESLGFPVKVISTGDELDEFIKILENDEI